MQTWFLSFFLLIEQIWEIVFGLGVFCLATLWVIGRYILKSWRYLLFLQQQHLPVPYQVTNFIVYFLSLKWMNRTMWISWFWNILAWGYHIFLFGNIWSATIFQATALLMELAIAPNYEHDLKKMDDLIEIGAKRISVIIDRYRKYTLVFVTYFSTTYALRLFIFFQFSDQLNLDLTIEKVDKSITYMLLFAIFIGWVISSIALKRISWDDIKCILGKIMRALALWAIILLFVKTITAIRVSFEEISFAIWQFINT